MRSIRDAACLLVAVGSIGLAAWQPIVATDHAQADAAIAPNGAARPVDHRIQQTSGHAILNVHSLKA